MVFHFRCFSLSFHEEEQVEIEEEEEEDRSETSIQTQSTSITNRSETAIQTQSTSITKRSETAIQTQSTSITTYYTAYSNFNLPNSEAEKTNQLRVFTFADLKTATNNFEGGCYRFEDGTYGSVYRGEIKSLEHPFHKIQVAVKDTNEKLRLQPFEQQMYYLVVVEHPNFVKAIGHCLEDNDEESRNRVPWLLVYEYMSNRSIEYHLSRSSKTPLSWNIRLKVAQDIACGLAYLHQQTNSQVTFGFFTCSNVLLDDEWNAKLWNFWFARFCPKEGLFSHAKSMVSDTGYMAPQIQTGDHPSKLDVWSYGVFLYELITGRLRLDTNGTQNKHDLVEWVKDIGPERFESIIDPRLEGNYSLESVQKLSFIANKCLSIDPKSRPNMSEALQMVNQLVTAVPSQAPPLNSFVSVVPIERKMVFTHVKKAPEKTKSKGKTGSIEVKRKETRSTEVKRKETRSTEVQRKETRSTEVQRKETRSTEVKPKETRSTKVQRKEFVCCSRIC